MKIARRKLAQAGNWVFNPGNAEMCVSNRVEQFPAGYFRAGSVASQATQTCEDSSPEGRTARLAAHSVSDGVLERAHLCALKDGGLGFGSDGGRHDRLPFSAQGKGDFRPRIKP
jgi:hypothetical protein